MEQNNAVNAVADGWLDPMERNVQIVEIPLEAFGLEDETIGSIRFMGQVEGEFRLDDLELVSHVQRQEGTAVLGESSRAPGQFTLGQSYPNPFNSQVVIPFALNRDERVELASTTCWGSEWPCWSMGGARQARTKSAGTCEQSKTWRVGFISIA